MVQLMYEQGSNYSIFRRCYFPLFLTHLYLLGDEHVHYMELRLSIDDTDWNTACKCGLSPILVRTIRSSGFPFDRWIAYHIFVAAFANFYSTLSAFHFRWTYNPPPMQCTPPKLFLTHLFFPSNRCHPRVLLSLLPPSYRQNFYCCDQTLASTRHDQVGQTKKDLHDQEVKAM